MGGARLIEWGKCVGVQAQRILDQEDAYELMLQIKCSDCVLFEEGRSPLVLVYSLRFG